MEQWSIDRYSKRQKKWFAWFDINDDCIYIRKQIMGEKASDIHGTHETNIYDFLFNPKWLFLETFPKLTDLNKLRKNPMEYINEIYG